MRVLARLRRRRTPLAVTAVGALFCAYVGFAMVAQGVVTARSHLHEQAVWIENSGGALARFDATIDQLDARIPPTGTSTGSLFQQGLTTVVTPADSDAGSIETVDAATLQETNVARLVGGETVSFGGNTLAVASPESGKVWAASESDAQGLLGRAPLLRRDDRVSTVVGTDGDVHVYVAGVERVVDYRPSPSGGFTTSTAGIALDDENVAMSAVGSVAVVLGAGGLVAVAGGPTSSPVPGSQQVLQQPGPAASVVYVASDTGLYAVPIGGGSMTTVLRPGRGDAGPPLAPVVLGGCVYAGWPKDGIYASSCDGVAGRQVIPQATANQEPVFLVNDGIGVLNDRETGRAWLLGAHFRLVVTPADWVRAALASNPNASSSSKGDKQTVVSTCRLKAPDLTFGARPGRATLLDVLSGAPQCNAVTTIERAQLTPSAEGSLSIVDGGEALQVTLPATAPPGSLSISYAVSDGLTTVKCVDSCEGKLSLVVYGENQETPPRELPESTPIPVAVVGHALRIEALDNWTDREGDPLSLVSAAPADEVTFSADGTVLFTPQSIGVATLTEKVADDRGGITTGTYRVDVVSASTSVPPVVQPALATGTVGQPISVQPLADDWDPSGLPLVVSSITGGTGLEEVDQDGTGGVTVEASEPGVYYVDYVASELGPPGAPSATSQPQPIRIDVSGTASGDQLILPMSTARLPSSGEVSVPVLQNAIDTSGSVLVVQSLSVPVDAPFTASIRQGQYIVLADEERFTGTVTVPFTASDGKNTATGLVEVVNTPTAALATPIATPDEAVVEAGSVGAVDVLANDLSPDGSPLSIEPGSIIVDQVPSGSSGTEAFADGSAVRVVAPDTPGEITVQYSALDENGLVSAPTTVSIEVVAPSQAQAPVAPPVVARVYSGESVVIPIPLGNADPDGETVTLVGLDSAPTRGTAVIRSGSVVYTALPDQSGTDRFSYEVVSEDGEEATGTVTVGVVPPPVVDAAPVAVPQSVTARPGQAVVVPVLAEDFDPQGLALSVTQVESGAGEMVNNRSAIRTTAPATNGATSSVTYQISDGYGESATGTVTVKAEAGFDRPPVAVDDVVSVLQHPFAADVSVNLLTAASDPAGSHSDLRLVALTGVPRSDWNAGGEASVPLTKHEETYAYEIRGAEGTAWATLTVPPRGTDVPHLSSSRPLQVPEGGSVPVNVADLVTDPAGRPLRLLPDQPGLWSEAPSGSAVDVTGPMTFQFTPAQGYSGPAVASFEVAYRDVPSGSAVAPLARIELPILVVPRSAPPFSFHGPSVTVVAGHTTVLNLDAYVSVPEGLSLSSVISDLSFGAPTSLIPGLTASIDGAQHTLSLDASAAKVGAAGGVQFSVTSGSGEVVSAVIDVEVQQTDLPPPSAASFTVTAYQQQRTPLDLVGRSTNPDSGVPLRLDGKPKVTSGAGSLFVQGDTVWYLAPRNSSGTALVTYLVEDGLGRVAQGVVTIDIVGPPTAPTIVAASQTGVPSTVDVEWNSPMKTGGESLTGYELRWQGSSSGTKDCGLQISCTVEGLEVPGSYEFEVRSLNSASAKVGPGAWSGPAEVTLNQVPDAVPGLAAKFANGAVDLSWKAPRDKGTRITGYSVTMLSPAGLLPRGAGTHLYLDWGRLQNGQTYCFDVRASNKAGAGPASQAACAVPATAPGAPSITDAVAIPDAAGGAGEEISVSWSRASPNGAPITAYEIERTSSTGDEKFEFSATPPYTEIFSGLTNGVTYTFTVVAENKAGASAPSNSEAVLAYGAPGVPPNLAASCASGSCTVSWSQPSTNGSTSVSYELQETDVTLSTTTDFTTANVSYPISGLASCDSYTFEIRAFNGAYSDWSAPTAQRIPEDSLSVPGLTDESSGYSPPEASFAWSGSLGGCSATVSWGTSSTGPWNSTTATGSTTISGSSGQTVDLWLQVTDGSGFDLGQVTQQIGSEVIPSPPPPSVSVSLSWSTSSGSGESSCPQNAKCYFDISASGFGANQSLTVGCYDNLAGDASPFYSWTTKASASGTYSIDPTHSCYEGPYSTSFSAWIEINGNKSNEITYG